MRLLSAEAIPAGASGYHTTARSVVQAGLLGGRPAHCAGGGPTTAESPLITPAARRAAQNLRPGSLYLSQRDNGAHD
jgi:hypothetical protein